MSLLTAACGSPDGGGPRVAQSGSLDAATVRTAELLVQIRGHQHASLELYRAGDDTAALVHAAHPIHEILASVTGPVSDADSAIADALETGVEAGRQLVEDGAPVADVEAAFAGSATAVDDAVAAIAGDEAGPAFTGSVVAFLLNTSVHEYEEALVGGKTVKNVPEYQDAFAFVGEAARLYAEVEDAVAEANPADAEEAEEAFEVLGDAFPSASPPKDLVDLDDVESAANLVAHELEETISSLSPIESDPEEIAENIDELLTEVLEAYEAGDADGAAELAAEAYLDNYEAIEAEVIEYAEDVNADLEPLLGAELRRRIQNGAPVQEIRDLIAQIRALMADALAALEDAGS